MLKPKPPYPKINPNHPLAKGLVGYWPYWRDHADIYYVTSRQYDIDGYSDFRDKIKDRMGGK